MVKLKNVQSRKGVGVLFVEPIFFPSHRVKQGNVPFRQFLQYCDLLPTALSARVDGDAVDLVAAG